MKKKLYELRFDAARDFVNTLAIGSEFTAKQFADHIASFQLKTPETTIKVLRLRLSNAGYVSRAVGTGIFTVRRHIPMNLTFAELINANT